MAYSEEQRCEIQAVVCSRLSNGESLIRICRDSDMPNISTIMDWLSKDDDFSVQYARARQVQADTLFYECLDIVDCATVDNVNVARLQVDARKWMAGKLRPKVYGNDLTLKGDAENPLQVTEIVRTVVDVKNED